MINPQSQNEAVRLAALRRYEILDTPPDGAFDRVTSIAARIFRVPISIVTLVDEDRIWFKSRHGIDIPQIPRDPGLCASCILGDEVLAITNAVEDARVLANPLVAGEFGLRFYAGAPLRTREGHGLGSLCVIGFEPRPISKEEEAYLKDLAAVVMDEIELRLSARRLARYEDHLRQAQKMEAISQLSGGIAHHFNNILTSTIGYLHLAKGSLESGSPALPYLEQVERNHQRASQLTHYFLTFSRRQIVTTKAIDLSELVRGAVSMVQPLLPGTIRLKMDLPPRLGVVEVNSEQLEQAVLNLIINARDAMPHGGELSVKTERVHLDEDLLGEFISLPAGDYMMLSVTDTGVGMDAATRSRIFEPFFTTKEVGKGTGLGLSVAHAIVNQANGGVHVETTPGGGSSFRVYLPVTAKATEPAQKTVLVVEDEPEVREVIKIVLRQEGFQVIEARHGREAMSKAADTPVIDLLVTDLIMPQMGGVDLIEGLLSKRPGLPVLAISGHAAKAPDLHGPNIRFLAKPFHPADLIGTVRELFEEAEVHQHA